MSTLYTYAEKQLTLKEWAALSGINYTTLRSRVLYRKWSIAKALTAPVQKQYGPCLATKTKRCTRCGQQKGLELFTRLRRRNGKEFSPACRDCDRARTREMRKSQREEVLRVYSDGKMCCAICDESRVAVLDLDHIDGGGLKHRREFKSNYAMLIDLKRKGFPPGYRVLCRNCNWLEWLARLERTRNG